jgi:hypothetical protein
MNNEKKPMSKMIPAFVVALVVVAGVSFYAGMRYQQSIGGTYVMSQNRGNFNGPGGTAMMRGGGGNRNAAGFATGEILSKDDTSITLKLRDGGSKIVFVSPSSQVMKSSAGTLADLKIGDSVLANGTPNPDGSVTAQTVQIRPPGLPGTPGPGGQPTPAPTSVTK